MTLVTWSNAMLATAVRLFIGAAGVKGGISPHVVVNWPHSFMADSGSGSAQLSQFSSVKPKTSSAANSLSVMSFQFFTLDSGCFSSPEMLSQLDSLKPKFLAAVFSTSVSWIQNFPAEAGCWLSQTSLVYPKALAAICWFSVSSSQVLCRAVGCNSRPLNQSSHEYSSNPSTIAASRSL